MSLYNCHKQQPQPWMSYISPAMITFNGDCCSPLVTNLTGLLPFQIISAGDYVSAEIRPYGDVWVPVTLTIDTILTEGFFIHSFAGGATDYALACGMYEFRVIAGEMWWFEPFTVVDFALVTNGVTLRDDMMTPLKFSEQQLTGIPVIAPCDSFLPFMFRTSHASTAPTYFLVDIDGTETALTITVDVSVIDGMTYYIHNGDCFYPFLTCGTYRIKIVDGAFTYWSVEFNAVCDMNDIPDGYRAMVDFNGCVMRDEDGDILYEECVDIPDVFLNTNENPTKVYSYNVASKSYTLLDIPNITRSSGDIANTENKLWLYNFNGAIYTIKEWDITTIPFTAVYNREITNIYSNAGLCAKSESILISQSYTNPNYIVRELDITSNPAVATEIFNTTPGRNVLGDYILTTTNKFITITGGVGWLIEQYDYLTGVREIAIDIVSLYYSFNVFPYGLFEYNNEIYIATRSVSSPVYGQIFKIEITHPYNISLYDTLPFGIDGASQIPSAINVHFIV